MNIIFEKTSGLRSGGTGHEDRSHYGANTRADLIQLAERSSALAHPVAWSWGKNDHALTPLPSGSIQTARAPLKRSNFAQSIFDVFALLAIFLFFSVTGVGLAFAFFVCLFVSLT